MDTETLQFGEDINATPLASLQQPPPSVATSRKDLPPVEPPRYDPSVPAVAERHVRFDLPKKKKKRKHKPDPWMSQQPQYYQPYVEPVAAAPAPEKKKKIVEFLSNNSHALLVFVSVGAILWYSPRIAEVAYLGSEGRLTTLGIALMAIVGALGYSIGETIVD